MRRDNYVINTSRYITYLGIQKFKHVLIYVDKENVLRSIYDSIIQNYLYIFHLHTKFIPTHLSSISHQNLIFFKY